MKLALSIDEASTTTGICKSRLYDAIKCGDLPAKKYGKRTIVLQADLEGFLAGLRTYGAAQ